MLGGIMQTPYAPPTSDVATTPGRYAVTIPGVESSSAVIVQRSSMWSGAKLLVDGQPPERAGLGKMKLPGGNGESVIVRLHDGLNGMFVKTGNTRIPVGPQISKGLGVLVFIPFGLAGVGGLVGGLIGGVGWAINRGIAFSDMNAGVKAVLMIGVFLIGLALTVLVGGSVRAMFS
jgi:hypothetical protein